ncbi:hypothetical protein DUI37_28460 [Bacillus anthracis]|nr:hypothetical protein DUI37_28460 [Bacillus anthracis]
MVYFITIFFFFFYFFFFFFIFFFFFFFFFLPSCREYFNILTIFYFATPQKQKPQLYPLPQ